MTAEAYTVTLPHELQARVEEMVATGGYMSGADAIQAIVQQWHDEGLHGLPVAFVRERLAEADRAGTAPENADVTFGRLRERYSSANQSREAA